MPMSPRSPFGSTLRVRNGVPSNVPFLMTRSVPPCSHTNMRPSGACAIAVALFSEPPQWSTRLKPCGRSRPPPKLTSALAQADTLPAASRARARTTGCPEASVFVSKLVLYGAVVAGAPTGTPSTWKSTLCTPTLSLAFADSVIVPSRPDARLAGAVSAMVGGWVSPTGSLMFTVCALEVVVAPLLSVARAVSVCAPDVAGVHEMLYGLDASSPIFVAPSKNSTLAIVPSLSEAVALSVIGVPRVPVAGADSATLGGWFTTGPMSVKFAVYVVLAAGVEMVWVAAPPSLQLAKRYLRPLKFWSGAPRSRSMPTTPVIVVGAVTGWPSSVSCRPAGWVASVKFAFCGSRSRVTSVIAPWLSVARRWNRYQMLGDVSPRTGIVTVPLPPAVSGWNGCVWVSWWSSAHQVSRLAGTLPSSGSVALPLKLMVWPARKVWPDAGLLIVATGGWFAGPLLPISQCLPTPNAGSLPKYV